MNNTDIRRLAVILHDSIDAITVQDLTGKILSWNRGATKMYGYPSKEAVGMNIRKIVPKDKHAEVTKYLKDISNNTKVKSFETQRITKTGKLLDVWIVVTCLKDDEGVIDSIATTERDITDIKNELRQKEAEVNVLKGLLPICASCKQIRDDSGYWHQMETYIENHSDALFSHGLCPKCEKKLYGNQEWYKNKK